MTPGLAQNKTQLPHTTWEQRKPFYADLEELISPGFISRAVDIAGVSVCIRSLCPGDLFLIRQRVGRTPREEDWMLWTLASCTWMVNGEVLLGDVNSPVRLYHLYKRLPSNARKALFSLVLSVFKRVSDSSDGLQAFCYEERSRSLWFQFGGQNPSSEIVTGIPGTSGIGMNYVQRMWVAYNQVEDKKLEELSYWQHAKFIASAHSPKGVQQTNNREKAGFEREKLGRQEDMDNYYYRCIRVLQDTETLADGRTLHRRLKSIQELESEFKRWVTGEKDQHDIIVENWKRMIQERYEEERRRREQDWLLQREEQLALTVEEDPEAPQRLVGYDAATVAQMLQERGQSHKVRKVYLQDKQVAREYLYNEFLTKEDKAPPPGGFVVKDGVDKLCLPDGPQTLDQQLAKRHLRYGPGPEESE